jgi:hypothetical protein
MRATLVEKPSRALSAQAAVGAEELRSSFVIWRTDGSARGYRVDRRGVGHRRGLACRVDRGCLPEVLARKLTRPA